MDAPRIVSLVVLAVAVLAISRMIWWVWRIVRGNEQMESGGSEGRQFFGRSKAKDN